MAGAKSKSAKPLYVPIVGDQSRPKARFPHMLPSVARMVINEWDDLSSLLHAALAEVPAAALQGGHWSGSPTKAEVKAQRNAAEQRAASAENRANSAEKETTKAKKAAKAEVRNGFF